jgi:Fic family protein
MKYTSLLTLFHEGKYEEIKKRLQNARNDSAFFELDINISGAKAFFVILPMIYESIINIIRISDSSLRIELPSVAVASLTKKWLVDEIVTTNGIEGVQSSRRDINDILNKQTKNSRLSGIVNKYRLISEKTQITIEEPGDIRAIYNDLVLDEVSMSDSENIPDGVLFRKGEVGVLNAGGKVIHAGLAPESSIIETMEKSLEFLNNSGSNELVRIAVFHYLFGYIHPFYDGNGRTNRFISSVLLSRNLNPLLAYRLSYNVYDNRSKYYKAFQTVNHPENKGDLTPFIVMFLDIIEQAAKDLFDELKTSKNSLDKCRESINNLWIPDGRNKEHIRDLFFVLAQATLFAEDGMTNNELAEHFKVSEQTISYRRALIGDLIETKIVGRQRFYKLKYKWVMELIKE